MTLTQQNPIRIDRRKQSLSLITKRGIILYATTFVPPNDWAIIYDVKFTDLTLDQSKFWTRYIETGPDGPGTLDYLNDEYQRYRETGNHVLNGDVISLTALPPVAAPPYTAAGDLWYPSGMLRSKDLFPITDGRDYFFEAECQLPAVKGGWCAFWLSGTAKVPDDVSTVFWPPEIDIMEIVNNAGEDTTAMLGARCQVLDWTNNPQQYAIEQWDQNYNTDFGVWYAPFDFAQGFHKFQLHYKRPKYAVYCDNQLIVAGNYDWVWDTREDAPPPNILLNFAVGGSWAGRYGIDDTGLPDSLQCRSIRVWRSPKSNTGNGSWPIGDGEELPKCPIGVDYEVT